MLSRKDRSFSAFRLYNDRERRFHVAGWTFDFLSPDNFENPPPMPTVGRLRHREYRATSEQSVLVFSLTGARYRMLKEAG